MNKIIPIGLAALSFAIILGFTGCASDDVSTTTTTTETTETAVARPAVTTETHTVRY